MSHPNTELEEMINFFKIYAEKILQENRELLDKLLKDLKVKEVSSPEMLLLLGGLSGKAWESGPLEKFMLFENLHTACAIISLIEGPDLKEINDEEQLFSALTLGYFCGRLEKHDSELTPTKLYTDFYHSLKSKTGVEKRWETPKKQLKEALKIADKKWKDGDEAWHYEMEEYLLSMRKNRLKRFPDLTKGMLKKNLNPIARKYNRLFGLKGVTKKYSPMKKS